MDGIVRYLSAVYPAAAPRLRTLGDAKLRALFESLDYYYACDPARSASYTRMPACAAVEALGLRSHELPPLPYVPPGTFYRVQEPIRLTESGSFTRFTKPVFLVSASRTTSASNFYSSWHARVGPAPSWTSPAAILRYVWAPNGLRPAELGTRAGGRTSTPHRATSGPALLHPPTAGNSARWAALAALRDGDWLEVEQYGGPMWNLCPDKCGLWANIWRGTGVYMRVRQPFVSYSKMTAIVEMAEAVEARGGAHHLQRLVKALGLSQQAHAGRSFQPDAGHAAVLVHALVSYAVSSAGAPCTASDGYEEVLRPLLSQSWVASASSMRPDDVVSALKLRGMHGNTSTAYAMHWLFGSCGVGVWVRTGGIWAGLDSMVSSHRRTHTTAAAAGGGGSRRVGVRAPAVAARSPRLHARRLHGDPRLQPQRQRIAALGASRL